MKPILPTFTFLIVLAAASAVTPAAGSPPAPAPVGVTAAYVDGLVAEGRAHNAALRSAEAQTGAAEAAVSAVRTWADPMATFGVWAPTARGMKSSQLGDLVYGVEEQLPLYGRPDLTRSVASADAASARFAAEAQSQRLRRDIRVALDGLALAGLQADVAGQDLAWIDATLSGVGRASQVDWLRIQTARAVAGEDLKSRERDLDHAALALNRLLNRDLHAAWPRIATPVLRPPLSFSSRLVEAARAGEPQLKVMRQESVSAQAAADLTRRQRLPDVSLGLETRQYSGDGGIREGMVTVNFSVPWLNRNRYDDEWRRDRLRKRSSELAAEDYETSVQEELHHHVLELEAARRKALLYRDQLIPLTRQTLSSAQAAWEANLGPFQDVLDAHRMLLADQLALAQALTDQDGMLTEIALLAGIPDPDSLFALEEATPSTNDSAANADPK